MTTVQRTPGGRSFSKSNTHSRSLVQRPAPLLAWASLQLRLSGAGALGSPNWTAALSNFATTWRTRATSPWGERLVICKACAPHATSDRLAANNHFCAFRSDGCAVELRHHLAHASHLALGRKTGDLQGLRAPCHQRQAGGQQPFLCVQIGRLRCRTSPPPGAREPPRPGAKDW